jgi:hypothetical protein
VNLGKFAFPQTLLSSKICGFAPRELEIRATQCLLPSVVKDHRSEQPMGTSPLLAERRVGLESTLRKKNRKQIKNPATSAGRIRPSLWAPIPRALGRMCSKLVFFLPGVRNQPHLWISRQARSVSRLPRESGLHQLQSSIAISKIPSSDIHDFFTCPSQWACEIHWLLWKSPLVLRLFSACADPSPAAGWLSWFAALTMKGFLRVQMHRREPGCLTSRRPNQS